MEYLAKIVHEEKLANSKLWKYNFTDIQTNQADWFYNHGRIDCVFGLIGKLDLSENHHAKTFQSFEPDLVNTVRELEKEKAFTNFANKTNQIIKKLDNDFARKKKFELLPQQIAKLRQEGHSWKYIADFYQVNERTIRRWRRASYKPLKKEGRKEKVSGVDLIYLLCYVLFGKKTLNIHVRICCFLFPSLDEI